MFFGVASLVLGNYDWAYASEVTLKAMDKTVKNRNQTSGTNCELWA